MEKLSPRRRIYDRTMRVLLWLAGGITCALLAFMIGYIFFRGIPNLTWPLVSGQTSYLKNTIGIFPNIVNTLYIYANERGETAAAFAIATILLALTLLINLSASIAGRRLRRR